MDCLGCLIGGVRLGVAISDIDQIVGYELSPLPPLAEEWADGVGLYGGAMFISICLKGKFRVQGSEFRVAGIASQNSALGTQNSELGLQRKGLLMKPTPQGARWALEVDSISHVLSLQVSEKTLVVPHWRTPQRWVLQAQLGGQGSEFGVGGAAPPNSELGTRNPELGTQSLGWLNTQAVHSRVDGAAGS